MKKDDKIESRRRLPLLALLYYFLRKKWNFSGRALSQEKRKDHAK